jgi:hypothetical protein
MPSNTSCRTKINWLLLIKYLIFFCAVPVLLTRYYDYDDDDEIPIAGNACLYRNEGSNGGYEIALKHDEHFFSILVEPNPLKIYYTPSRIFVIQDYQGIISYKLITFKKDTSGLPKVVELEKTRFEKEVKNCTSCKKIQLVLDTTHGRWIVKK